MPSRPGLPDGYTAATISVLLITIISGQLIIADTAGDRKSSPAFRNRDTLAAALVALVTALAVAVIAGLAFAAPAGAVVLLPASQAQIEASASRARLLAAMPTYPVLEAQRNIEALLADEETFRTCVTLGLPTGRLQMPAMLDDRVLQTLELGAAEPAALRAAGEAYASDAARANEHLALAEGAQMDQRSQEVAANLDIAFTAVRRCKVSLQQVLAAGARP